MSIRNETINRLSLPSPLHLSHYFPIVQPFPVKLLSSFSPPHIHCRTSYAGVSVPPAATPNRTAWDCCHASGRDAPFAARRRYRQQSGQDSSLPKRSTEQVADRFLGKTDTIKSLVVRLQLSRSGGAFLPVPPGFGISFCACFSLSEKAISCPAFFKNHSCRQTYLFMLQSPLFSVPLHGSL